MVCPKCGFNANSICCPQCGTKLSVTPPDQMNDNNVIQGQQFKPQSAPVQKPEKIKKNNSKLVIIIIAVVAVIAIGVAAFLLLGKKADTPADSGDKTEVSDSVTVSEEDTQKILGSVSLEKVFTCDKNYISKYSGGIVYKENDKYGIISYDGIYDTGAVYTYCQGVGNCFAVSKTTDGGEVEVDKMNKIGLVDGNGKELLGEQYAVMHKIGDNFIAVCKATEKADNKDDSTFYVNVGSSQRYYKGSVFIYSLEIEDFIDDEVEVSSLYNYSDYEGVLKVKGDNGEEKIFLTDGTKIPETARPMNYGFYYIDNNGKKTIYDYKANELFTLSEEYIVIDAAENYFSAYKYDDEKTYTVLDKTGKEVSKVFDDYITIVGDLIVYKEQIVDMQGNAIIEGNFTKLEQSNLFTDCYYASSDTNEVIFKADGTILYSGEKDELIYVDYNELTVYRDEAGAKRTYYSYADQSFSIEGTSYTAFTAITKNADGTYNLVDLLSGKTILQNYSSISGTVNGSTCYVFASNGDQTEIYRLK